MLNLQPCGFKRVQKGFYHPSELQTIIYLYKKIAFLRVGKYQCWPHWETFLKKYWVASIFLHKLDAGNASSNKILQWENLILHLPPPIWGQLYTSN